MDEQKIAEELVSVAQELMGMRVAKEPEILQTRAARLREIEMFVKNFRNHANKILNITKLARKQYDDGRRLGMMKDVIGELRVIAQDCKVVEDDIDKYWRAGEL